MMNKNKSPIRLVLNTAASKEIEWHCRHYAGRGLMRKFDNGEALAKEMGISPKHLEKTFETYNAIAEDVRLLLCRPHATCTSLYYGWCRNYP
ncbi:hypothetical protein G6F57_022697 [Rhizopus arrhizus]|nr:hypothetical protein G6F57_022697 [Rhizopus arrhizus]